MKALSNASFAYVKQSKRILILLGVTNAMLFLPPGFLLSMLSLKHQKHPQKWLARYFFLYHH